MEGPEQTSQTPRWYISSYDCIWFRHPRLLRWHFKFPLCTASCVNILFPFFLLLLIPGMGTCATASMHFALIPLRIWLLKPPYYWNYSYYHHLPKFNNLFSIWVLLNLLNSWDSRSLSLYYFLSCWFSFLHSWHFSSWFITGLYSNLVLCPLLLFLNTHMLCPHGFKHFTFHSLTLLQSHVFTMKWQHKSVTPTVPGT